VKRAAIVQDWFFPPGGSEEVAMEFAEVLPGSDVYTSFADRSIQAALAGRLRTWPLQRLLGPTPSYRKLLPLYALWFERLDLRRYALVVSSSIAFTHAVRTAPTAMHISYVYTPIRYAWDLDTYLQGSSFGRLSSVGARILRPWLQRWDRRTASRPDVVVAISETVRHRIKALWGREAEVIYPPVSVEEIEVSNRDDGYLLVAARMLAYRRLDLAIGAANALGRLLVVIGDGPERQRLEAMAGPTVRFLGRVDRPTLLDAMARCHAYLVPGIEDFGIAPVEAMAFGKPVVGFNGGGVAETVIDGRTGVLFNAQTVESMVAAIERLDGLTLDPGAARAQAERFDRATFRAAFRALFELLGVDPSLYSAE
jgi:glycosyltransferase involved in cell wall biosynthesis